MPLDGSHALRWDGGRDLAVRIGGESNIGLDIFNWQPLDGSGVEQVGIPLPDVQLEQGVDVDAVVALHGAVAHHRLDAQFFFPQGEHLAGAEMQKLIGVFHDKKSIFMVIASTKIHRQEIDVPY